MRCKFTPSLEPGAFISKVPKINGLSFTLKIEVSIVTDNMIELSGIKINCTGLLARNHAFFRF